VKYLHRQSLCIALLGSSDPLSKVSLPFASYFYLGVLCAKTSLPGSLCAAMRKSFPRSPFFIDFIWPDPRAIFVRRPFTLFMLILAKLPCFFLGRNRSTNNFLTFLDFCALFGGWQLQKKSEIESWGFPSLVKWPWSRPTDCLWLFALLPGQMKGSVWMYSIDLNKETVG